MVTLPPNFLPIGSLGLAALLDYFIGDPWGWPHPVQGMGRLIHVYARWVLKRFSHPQALHIAGGFLGVGLTVGSGVAGWLLAQAATQLEPIAGFLLETTLLASCLAGRSLRRAAEDVLKPLRQGDVENARSRLSLYVGRDTQSLGEPEILRALMETVTENATDGVMAPLFYALLGALLGLGPAPLALAYKAASTLDSMVGYRQEPYAYLGWFSARMEDGLTWIPCRLTVLTIALLSGKPIWVLRICRRDAIADPSPNAGWSECAYAAALGVQLGGVNYYQGQKKIKPLLGNPLHPITPARIRQAMQFTRFSFILWLTLGIIGLSLAR
ncbi:MAG: adenosylcobinamide-phosphate synthase CbiB [Leptolyngbyaceae cyanobacterium MO_188.B28]|nr:adenosylcobinamide-phosphate synthase CbiB [Leptolyngbyaceae cyanobacterium MO_188.B28]